MPEYLAPGVYIEEVPSGSKPIEGASTSTAGMVGMTERGPVGRPILVTAPGQYARIFGGALRPDVFTEHRDALPYAAEGFFANGGRRLYVVRVVGDAAQPSSLTLVALATGDAQGRTLGAPARAQETSMLVAAPAGVVRGDTLLIEEGERTEAVQVAALRPTLTLAAPPAAAFGAGATVTALTTTALTLQNPPLAAGATSMTLAEAGTPNGAAALVGARLWVRADGNDRTRDAIVAVASADDQSSTVTFAPALAADMPGAQVSRLDDGATTQLAGATRDDLAPPRLDVESAEGFTAGRPVRIEDAGGEAFVFVTSVDVDATRLTLARPLGADLADGADVVRQALAATSALQGDLAAGDTTFTLADASGLAVGDRLYLRDAGTDRGLDEFLTVAALAVNDVTVAPALARDHTAASEILILTDVAAGGSTRLARASVAPGAGEPARIVIEAAAGIAAGAVIRVSDAQDTVFAVVTEVAVDPQTVLLTSPLTFNHAAGARIMRVTPALEVFASSQGAWGDALQVYTREAFQLDTQLDRAADADADTVHLRTAFGLFPGSILAFWHGEADGEPTGVTRAIVATVDPVSGTVTLTAPLGRAFAVDARVRSQEFHLNVERLVDGKVAETETFEKLSLSPHHPRYAPTIVGSYDVGARRPSETGGSSLVRLALPNPTSPDAAAFAHGIRRRLTGGRDDVAGVNDQSYIGVRSDDPRARTGIQALQNERAISIVAVPGRTSVTVQKALIEHCERMVYRFAVLDTPLGVDPAGARTHRQNFDNTRAAVYYPGLTISDRFGPAGALRNIHPSGHVLGIYARTDVTRGVHKAPANEVVRGVLAFDTKLGKGEQDILNPLAVNCFRDFRAETRGLRLYGARVATSDPEFRYVNVRRLMLFIGQSLDNGLQWAVFEPNSDPLWDTVRQSVTNFLTTVWRSGALAGLKQEEAFFVNVGYNVTMTQDDLDNGRLIVEVGVAPVKPAEFVIVRLSQKTREATA